MKVSVRVPTSLDTYFWRKNTYLHRTSSPAWVGNYSVEWFWEGRPHNLKGPAIQSRYKSIVIPTAWYIHGHRAADKAQFLDKSWRRKVLLNFRAKL
jgi:hypothetical protein